VISKHFDHSFLSGSLLRESAAANCGAKFRGAFWRLFFWAECYSAADARFATAPKAPLKAIGAFGPVRPRNTLILFELFSPEQEKQARGAETHTQAF
jgi:hypothetical protein